MSTATRTAKPSLGAFGLLHWFFMRVLAAGVLVALVYFGWRYITEDKLNEEIRRHIEDKFRSHYSGLIVKVDSARRVPGQGIEIRGITIAEVDRPDQPPMLYVERMMAACDTDLAEFVTTGPCVRTIMLKRAKMYAVRRANGFWNVRHLYPPPKFSEGNPPIEFQDASVVLVDEGHREKEPMQLREISLSISPDPLASEILKLSPTEAKCPLRVTGELTGDHFKRVRLEGAADVPSGKWSMTGSVQGLQFTPALRGGLPRDLAAELAPISAVNANTHLEFQVDNLSPEFQPCHFSVSGSISEGRVDDERLPSPLTEIAARVFADNAGLQIEDLTARLGSAEIKASLRLDGYEAASPMILRLSATSLSLDSDLASALPEDGRALWQKLSPSGSLSGSLSLVFDGQSWQPHFECELSDLSLEYVEFPYRLTDGRLTLGLNNDLLTVKGRVWAGNSPVRCDAAIRNAGPDWYGWAEAKTEEPVPIDERLLHALAPHTRELVQAFSPRGSVQLLGRMDRREGAKNTKHHHIEVEMRDCSLQYEKFPYPFDHVSGTLKGGDGVWSFVGLRGSHGAAQVHCDGSYGPDQNGSLLSLDFRISDLALDETLRRALPVEQQKLWADLRPRGEFDVASVNLAYRPQQKKLTLEIDGQKLAREGRSSSAIRIEPIWFPYAMDFTAGQVHYRDGNLELRKLRANHDRTRIDAEGLCRWNPGGEWSLQFDQLSADRLQLDHDLLAALPGEVGKAIAKAKFIGNLAMSGNLSLAGSAVEGSTVDADWDLAFDVEDGRMSGDVPVDHIQGSLQLVGAVERGKWHSRGDVNVDSLFMRDVQLTRVQGPFYVDQNQLLLGSWSEGDTKKGPPRKATAQVFDGLLSADGSVSLGDDGKFVMECALDKADLAKIAQETKGGTKDVTGKVYGVLQVTGTTRGKHTWRGGGNVRLRDAYLYKVPVMVALLKLLSVRSPDSTAFTTSDIEYRIQGDDVILDRIDLTGDAISLKGRGRLSEQRQIDLLFYTQVGRRDIQPLRPLLAEASPHILLIEVKGTLDDPQTKKTAFPGINETLRQLFPDLARPDGEPTARTAVPWITKPGWLQR